MKNRNHNVLWGITFILLGIGFIGNVFGIWNFSLTAFEGWWTLFIIVPCGISLFSYGPKKGNIIGLAIGLVLLLNEINIIKGISVFDLSISILFIGIGVSFFFKKDSTSTNNKKTDYQDPMSDQNQKGE